MCSVMFVAFDTQIQRWSKTPSVCCAATCMNSFRNATQTFATWSLTIKRSIQRLKFIDFPFVLSNAPLSTRQRPSFSPVATWNTAPLPDYRLSGNSAKNRPPIYVHPRESLRGSHAVSVNSSCTTYVYRSTQWGKWVGRKFDAVKGNFTGKKCIEKINSEGWRPRDTN